MKKIALGWSVALAASFALAGNAGGRERCFRLYNVVPMYLGHEVEQAKACVEMYERTGEDLALYSLTLHPEGRPAQTKVDRYVASYRAFARALEGTGVRPGVLVQAILGHWPRTDKDVEPWERTIDQDGKAVRFCPLDPGFAAYVDYVFKSLAAERPAFILTDDDVRAFSHGAECFCRTHVRIFNERHNTDYDSDGLRAAVAASKPGEKVYDGFFALQREMMHEAVVGRIRRAIDSVDASLPAGFCIASEETCLAAPMAKGIAARGQVPVMRCATGCYAERLTAQRCPESFLRQMAFCEFYRGSDVDLLDEADTCPQNLWSKSARSFFTHMATACFAGMRGAKTWYVNSIRATGIPVTRAYTDVLAENPGFLDALAREVEGSHPVGVAIPCFTNRPAWHVVGNHEQCMVEQDGIFENYLAAFGIPGYACREFGDANRVFALTSAAEVDRMTDEELTRLLSGKVLVLRDAAVALTKRGLSWMTGVTAEMKPLLFNGERDCVSGAGFGYSPALSGSVEFRMAEGAERLSDLTFRPYAGAPEPEIVAPATVFYRNRLGGETITMAYHHRMYALQKFSEGRKRQLIALVDRLAGGPRFAVCENDQDVMTAERLTADGHHLMLVVNLSSDPIRRLKLRLPSGARLERLMPDGTWKKVTDDVRLEFYEAAAFRCKGWTSVALAAEPDRPVLIVNEDNDHYFKLDRSMMNEQKLNEYVDSYAKGHVTHFFMCPSGQRPSYDSKVWEPIWTGAAPTDYRNAEGTNWTENCRFLHEQGVDPYQVWISRCRLRGISPWLSPRMNDTHFAHITNYFRNTTFWKTRRDLWRKPDWKPGENGNLCAFDFSHAEARKWILDLIAEQLERYDIDGLELDWMRTWEHLTPGREREQAHYLTDMVRTVRGMTKRAAAKRGHPVRLGVRVPSDPDAALGFGLDVVGWAKEGLVDMIVASCFWCSGHFDVPLALWRERLGAAADRVELYPATDAGSGCVPGLPRSLTLQSYCGWADAMWAREAKGLYLFNLPYQGVVTRDWICEHGLGNKTVAQETRHYQATYNDCVPKGMPNGQQLPLDVSTGGRIRLASGAAATVGTVRVVVSAKERLKGVAWPKASLNGVVAVRADPIPENRLNLYRVRKNDAVVAVAYVFPASATKGVHEVFELAPLAGETTQWVWCQLEIPAVGR